MPLDEKYGLVSQMRRCAVSIPSNIAEGHDRNNTKEFLQFIGIARGSAAELETQLLLCKDIYELDVRSPIELLDEVSRLLGGTAKGLRAKL